MKLDHRKQRRSAKSSQTGLHTIQDALNHTVETYKSLLLYLSHTRPRRTTKWPTQTTHSPTPSSPSPPPPHPTPPETPAHPTSQSPSPPHRSCATPTHGVR